MRNKMTILHYLLLTTEVAALLALVLWFGVWPLELPVVHDFVWGATICLAMGGGGLVAIVFMRATRMAAKGDRGLRNVVFGELSVAVLLLGIGIAFAVRAFPEWMLPRQLPEMVERWRKMNAAMVRMDANGGVCGDTCRIVRTGGTYVETMNLYPSEDYRRMRLKEAKVDLREHWIVVDLTNSTAENMFVNYWTINAVPAHAQGGKWTYVVDADEWIGEFAGWYIGQTAEPNSGSYAQLAQGRVNPSLKAGERQFLILDSTKWGEKSNMLDRAYIHLKPGQHLKVKFRVSLFAGTGVNASNYHYVKPGETIACPLPVPTREGYEFEGWYDGETRVTETTKVEKRETHTLTARWRKRASE